MSSLSYDLEEVPDSEDELDFLSSPTTPTLVDSGTTTPAPSESSSRIIARPKRYDSKSAPVTPKKNKTRLHATAKRKFEEEDDFVVGEAEKKRTKREERKTCTIVINSKKAAVEAARRRWLYRHQHLFKPLLPASNHFFVNIADDIARSTDTGMYVPREDLEVQPAIVTGGEMKDYQLQGLSFLVWMYHNGMNCILGDEMGLGKTLQTLSLFAYIRENTKGTMNPHLIICPLSVVETWLREVERWIPSFKTLRFHAQQAERDRLKIAVRDGHITFDICVTTYEGYVAEDSWFKSRHWSYIVLDEGHKIKNANTNVASKLQGISSLYKLILTGTPVQNNLTELWGLLRWLYPSIFTPPTQTLFTHAFDLTHGSYSTPFLSATEKLLATIMLRRTKAVVHVDVPPREELTVFVPMSEAQRFWTLRLLMRLDTAELEGIFGVDVKQEDADGVDGGVKAYIANKIKESRTGQQNQWKRLMNLLIQLRQVCDHPYLLPDAEPMPYSLDEHIVSSSSKLIVVDKLLKDILPKGERVLIFSQWTSMLDLLEDFMELRGIAYARLDGSVPRPRRNLDIRLFQQEKSPYQVFLISTKAGGLGINLTKATTVIMFDSEWNPQNDLQAIARAHRIGQTKTVKVYRLICQGSVEDQMLDRLRRKLFLSLKIMGSDSTSANHKDDEQDGALKTRELMDILRKGSSALSRVDGLSLPRFLSAPIDEILQASRTRDESRAAKLKKELGEGDGDGADAAVDAEEEERRLLSGVAQVQSRLFEGRVVERVREHKDNKQLAAEWKELQKRARQTRIVMVDGYEVLAEHLGPEVNEVKVVPKKQGRKFDWEDWCIYCRDGGELILCSQCPRVFHPQCHGISKKALKSMRGQMMCPQHTCADCLRNTVSCGGMLFRCRTCTRAVCEDCLPEGDIAAVGDTLPEFLVRGFGAASTAYYIRCGECQERCATDTLFRTQWEEEFREATRKLAQRSESGISAS